MPPIKGRKIVGSKSGTAGQRVNTIGVSDSRLAALLDALDAKNGRGRSCNRMHVRWAFRHASINMQFNQPLGSNNPFPVACRNISKSGMAVLHSAFVNVDTPCTMEIPKLDGTKETMSGYVVRCQHLTGRIHELGIQFDDCIHIEQYVTFDLLAGETTNEFVDPQSLQGTVCIISQDNFDTTVLNDVFAETNMKSWSYNSIEQATESSEHVPDLLFVGMDNKPLPDELVRLHNLYGCPPMVVFGKRFSCSVRTLYRSQGVTGILTKPLAKQKVLAMASDCLERGCQADQEDLDIDMNASVADLSLEALEPLMQRLEDAFAQEDAMVCFTLCQQIRSLAIPAGFETLAVNADKAATQVAASMSTEESTEEINAVLRACRQQLSMKKAA